MISRNAVLFVLAGIGCGVAIASLVNWSDRHNEMDYVRSSPPGGDNGPAVGSLADRVATLEQALGAEQQARQWLEEEILYLGSELERLAVPGVATAPVAAEAEPGITEPSPERPATRTRGVARDLARLVNSGFTQAEAEWILRRESELQMQALRDRYEAERRGEAPDYFSGRDAAGDVLRTELGDEAYERYLAANRRSISVTVGSVLESSPAQAAGLVAGDEIVSYDGRRVFDLSDLTTLTKEGDPGQTVVVDILRGGQPMQVVIPRGPLGITGGRRYAR